jgi:hypothetical protein
MAATMNMSVKTMETGFTSSLRHLHFATGSQLVLQQLQVPEPQSADLVHWPLKLNVLAFWTCRFARRSVQRGRSEPNVAAPAMVACIPIAKAEIARTSMSFGMSGHPSWQ